MPLIALLGWMAVCFFVFSSAFETNRSNLLVHDAAWDDCWIFHQTAAPLKVANLYFPFRVGTPN